MANGRMHATNDEAAGATYREVLRALEDAGIRFLVGGTYALEHHAGFSRGTKDLDLFILEEDWPHVVAALSEIGLPTELTFSHWLGKAFVDEDLFVDFVFAGGNGIVRVTPDWFCHSIDAEVYDQRVRLCPAEEMIWSKAFIMERERFDGA